MAQTYSSAHLKVIDERFQVEGKTASIINKGIRLDFNGKNSVTIYNVDTVAENNYVRSGTNRYGAVIELGTGTQTFTLSQDKGATWTIDRGNYEDSMMVTEAASTVKRQIKEVSIPTVDIYRLAVLTSYAVANSQTATSALAVSDVFNKILVQKAALIDAEVDEDNLVLFITATTHNLLMRDPEFKQASDASYQDNKKGVVGMVAGMKIVVAPASYFVANFGFMIVADNVLVSPTKFDHVKTHDNPPGINGWLVEMRRYYDAFVPTNKGPAIRLHKIA